MSANDSLKVGASATLAFGITAQFTVQPILPYMNPLLFSYGGIILGFGLLFCVIDLAYDDVALRRIGWICLAVGTAMLAMGYLGATEVSIRSRKHCATIEKAMLTPPKHVRDDLPDVFTALGCKPQL